MQVVLLKDVKGTGKAGEIKEVSDGYAMNYLLPNRLVRSAKASDLNRKNKKSNLEKKQSKKHEEFKKLFKQLHNFQLNLTAKADGQNHLFGSINQKILLQELRKLGYEVPPASAEFEPIKTLGYHEIKMKMGDVGVATLKLLITKE